MYRTLKELKIGSYDHIHTVTEHTPIIHALKLFVQHRVSALPVVAGSGRNSFKVLNKFQGMLKTSNNNLDFSFHCPTTHVIVDLMAIFCTLTLGALYNCPLLLILG